MENIFISREVSSWSFVIQDAGRPPEFDSHGFMMPHDAFSSSKIIFEASKVVSNWVLAESVQPIIISGFFFLKCCSFLNFRQLDLFYDISKSSMFARPELPVHEGCTREPSSIKRNLTAKNYS